MTLSILQAKWQLGLVRPEELPLEATTLLADGVESPSLIQLAGLIRPDRWEATPVVDRVFEEARLAPLSDDAARWRLVYDTARAIVDQRTTPIAGATTLWHLATELGLPDEISYFVYLAADYGEGPMGSANEREWFDSKIVETAAEVLRGERRDQAPSRQAGV